MCASLFSVLGLKKTTNMGDKKTHLFYGQLPAVDKVSLKTLAFPFAKVGKTAWSRLFY